VRQNRDTLYSAGVFDLDAGPVTMTLPDPGRRFMSVQVIDQDEYTHDVLYGKGLHTFTREQIGTRYVAWRCAFLSTPMIPPTSPTCTHYRTRSSSSRTRRAASKCRSGIR
jgi:hypothetical protein